MLPFMRAFLPSLRTLNSFKVLNHTALPNSLNLPSCYIRLFLYDLRRVAASLAAWSSTNWLRIKMSECAIIFASLVRWSRASTTEVGELLKYLCIFYGISLGWDADSRMLLGVLDSHVLLSSVGGAGVRNRTSSFAATASGSNRTKPAPLNSPHMLQESFLTEVEV